MRSVCVGSLGLILAGCATVSVYPGESRVTTSLTAEQTELRKVSEEFCDMAEAEGWVAPGMAFGELARALFDGEAITDESRDLYAESIALGERPGIDVLALIIADAEGATRDLDAVNRVGTAFATGDETAKRGDVMKFERALVWAQKSHRSFATAVDTLAREGGLDVTAADTALSALNAEIEEARRIADALAGDLAVEGETGSGS